MNTQADDIIDYIQKLSRLLESVHDQILGNDYQSAVELRYLESQIIKKIKQSEDQLRQIAKVGTIVA